MAAVGIVFFGVLDSGPATAELAARAFDGSVWLAAGLFRLSFVASFLLPPRAAEQMSTSAPDSLDPSNWAGPGSVMVTGSRR